MFVQRTTYYENTHTTDQQNIISDDPDMHGSIFVSIILGSNKTTISVTTCNNEYYPVYLSIRNVQNSMWHGHYNVVILIGFLAIPKISVGYHAWPELYPLTKYQPYRNMQQILHFAIFTDSYFTAPYQEY